jgi:hypothetical protein
MATWVFGLTGSAPWTACGRADAGNKSNFRLARYTWIQMVSCSSLLVGWDTYLCNRTAADGCLFKAIKDIFKLSPKNLFNHFAGMLNRMWVSVGVQFAHLFAQGGREEVGS